MQSGKRVFQIGFNRCGTTTLCRFFHSNGVPAIHWDNGNIALNFAKRKAAGEDPFLDYPDIRFFSDTGTSFGGQVLDTYKEFRYIFRFYPDAYFILNVRNVQRWLLSRCNSGYLLERHQAFLGIHTVEEMLLHWTLDWSRHLKEVQEFFSDKPGQLLVFDIEKDDPARIVEFLKADFTLDSRHFVRSNETQRRRYERLPNYLVGKQQR